jgi:glutamate-5-semialdehyde dehydrogenase
MDISIDAKNAKNASILLAAISGDTKNDALKRIIEGLKSREKDIVSANKEDIKYSHDVKLAAPLIKRLSFDEKKIKETCDGIEALIRMEDPVGKTIRAVELDTNLRLFKVSCPIGVIGIIFESRPDALVQISSLCLKSGNAAILKGGREALQTNRILSEIIRDASVQAGLPPTWITLVETREDVKKMLSLESYIDLIIPRGSNEFVRSIMKDTSIPVLGHAAGICHVYIDSEADEEMALRVVIDSKCQYVAVCNALETLLVHKDIAPTVLPKIKLQLGERGVELRGDQKTAEIIDVIRAEEDDWSTEYLDYILSIKTVEDIGEAITHINTYGSHHTDSIVTRNRNHGLEFVRLVDSADVFINCSTRFSDGYKYGLGAEVGISTNKIHARGPVGMEGLLIYKWILDGNGQIVADYGPGKRAFTHKPIDDKFSMQ